jgi:hypothetical protein
LDGVSLVAPERRHFRLGLTADFDGDGDSDAVAWTVPEGAAPDAAAGELWSFPAGGAPRKLASTPGFIPTGPGCTSRVSLALTGPHSVTLDLAAHCEATLIARSPVRSLAVLAPAAPRPVLTAVRAAAPAPRELQLRVSSIDRDHDGNDDVELSVEVQAVDSKRPAVARLLWLDRAAGPSREPQEPLASLARAAGTQQSRARGKRTCRSVAEGVGNLRRLIATLCHESGTARLFDAEGAGLRCGELGPVVDQLAMAEVRAALTAQNVAEAAAVLARDGWYFGRASPKERGKLEALVMRAVRVVEAGPIVALAARPVPRTPEPRYSPLHFEQPESSLLVLTPQGVVRAAPDGSSELPVDEQALASAWSLVVTSPNGATWTGVSHACNQSELVLEFSPPTQSLSVPLLAARPGACAGKPIPRVSPPVPLGFEAGKLTAVIAGSTVGPRLSEDEAWPRPVEPGSARSPDGKLLVVPTPLGLLVTGDDKPELWQSPELEPWYELSDCAVAGGASALACIKANRVLLIRRGAAGD